MNAEEETPEADVTPEPEEKPKKERKPRKKRQPKAAKPEKDEEADDEDDFTPKKGEQFIRQEGNTITLSGRSVTLNGLSKSDIAKWSITKVEGAIGTPCKEPMKLTFKNRQAALNFFNACLEDESEDDEVISTTPSVKWFSEELGF